MASPLGLTIKSSINGMQVGDCIPCRYTALNSGYIGVFSELGTCTATEIPTTGTATPNGLFYFIHSGYDNKGRMKLIPDRNLQYSITWDALNTNGIASSIPMFIGLTPIMTSATTPKGTVFASSSYSTGPYVVFNKNISDYWSPNTTDGKGIIGYDFGILTQVNKYSIRTRGDNASYAASQAPNAWTFEGSNDGTTWNVLDTRQSQTSWTLGQVRNFSLNSIANYSQYRINITANNTTGDRVSISEIEFYNSTGSNFTLKLPTGGNSASDTDNEWDKIIVNSNLNGKITPGDNNVWNWNNLYSWCSTSFPGTAVNRVVRGYTASNTWYSGGLQSSFSGNTTGFRPILLIETLVTLRFLILDNGAFKTISNGNLITVANTTDSAATQETAFLNNGMSSLASINNAIINQTVASTINIALYKR